MVGPATAAGAALESEVIVKVLATLFALLLCALPVLAQQPEWYWTKIDADQYALWHNAQQIGNYRISDESYFPRLAPGKWGDACECPCYLPPPIEAALASYRKEHWKTRGVLMSAPSIRKANGSGLKYRNLPMPREKAPEGELSDGRQRKARCDCTDCPPECKCGCGHAAQLLESRAGDDVEKIPDYSTMPSLTLVAKDEADAKAALEMFEQAPELAHWRDKYGARAKAYSAAEFQHTSYAFKLDRDKRFQETGFVALIQPESPDESGRAVVHSCYQWATPEDAAKGLRNADPGYDPNPPPTLPETPSVSASPATATVWGKAIAGLGLGGSSLVMVLGAVAAALRTILR